MKKKTVFLALLLIAPAAVLLALLLRSEDRPNVILISIDSLRSDHLGCYGYTRDTTPVLDRIAGEGVLFETVVSSTSWTLPAHAALFTSLHDRVHGCFDGTVWLARSRETIAEAFKSAGYRTTGFFSGPYLHPVYGLSQGFDTYHDCTSYSEKTIAMLKGTAEAKELGDLSHKDVTNPIVLKNVNGWLDTREDGPFFMFVHLWDVHFDYIPPPPYDTMFDPDYKGTVDGHFDVKVVERPSSWTDRDVEHYKALYDGEIRWTDATLGKLFASLKARGLMDDTMIVITSDHGEAFYEHGNRGHRYSLHDEEIRIPLIIRFPPSIQAGNRIKEQVHIIDIAPTILKLAGLPPLPGALGRDLSPLIENQDMAWPEIECVSELIFPLNARPLFSIRTPEWKMILNTKNGLLEVYDMKGDPGEQAPLPEDRYPISPEALVNLYKKKVKMLETEFLRLPIPGKRDTPPVPEMTRAHLRSLGYLK